MLQGLGMKVEVFTNTAECARAVETEYGLLHFVRPEDPIWLRVARKASPRSLKDPYYAPLRYLSTARALGRAFAARHAVQRFDFVQTLDFHLTGFFLKTSGAECPQIMRLSSRAKPWVLAAGIAPTAGLALTDRLELIAMRRAHACYAPSRYLADLCSRDLGRTVRVIRPPLKSKPEFGRVALDGLPERFLFFFGGLSPRKGVEDLLGAVAAAHRRCPDLRLVLAGAVLGDAARFEEDWRRRLGDASECVVFAGVLGRDEIYSALEKCVAAVLPSLVDNLPNSVLESLQMGVPVIAYRAGSVDEVVEDGRSGVLLDPHDMDGLAEEMVAAWRGRARVSRETFQRPCLFDEMEPAVAAEGLLRLVDEVRDSHGGRPLRRPAA